MAGSRLLAKLRGWLHRPWIMYPIGFIGMGFFILYEWVRLRSSPLWGTSNLWLGVAMGVAGVMVGLWLVMRLERRPKSPVVGGLLAAYVVGWLIAFGLTHRTHGPRVAVHGGETLPKEVFGVRAEPVLDSVWEVTAVAGVAALTLLGFVLLAYHLILVARGWRARRPGEREWTARQSARRARAALRSRPRPDRDTAS